jgi:hypothetical protein
MVIGVSRSTKPGGKHRLYLCLQQENIDRLLNDYPIRKDMAEIGLEELEGWELIITGPEDTVRLAAHFGQELP